MYKRKTINDDPMWIGQKFGRLTVIGFSEVNTSSGHYVGWDCECDCGNVVYGKRPSAIKSGDLASCGCLKEEQNIRNLADHRRTHGKTETRLYGIWCKMKRRCEAINDPAYINYGGRGIKICDEWHDFQNFYDWAVANGYQDDLTIERVDYNKGYSPDNCTWITLGEQTWNKRDTRKVVVNGKAVPLKEACRQLGLPYKTIHLRITRYGMSFDEAIARPIREGKIRQYEYEYNGEMLTLPQIAELAEVKYTTLYLFAIRKGLPLDKALKKCPKHPMSSKNT